MKARLIEVGVEDPGIEVLKAGVDDVENLNCELHKTIWTTKPCDRRWVIIIPWPRRASCICTFRFDLNNNMLFCNSDCKPLLRVMFCTNLHRWSMPPCYKPTPDEMYCPKGDLKTNLPSPILGLATDLEPEPMEISTQHSNLSLQQCLHEMFGHVAMKRIRRLLPNHAKAEPMDIVSMDLMGPYDLSVNGGSWLMTARDAGSTYGECHILKRKADATSLAIELMTGWERQSGRAVKVLRTDGNGEFKNDTLKKWCSAKGIVHEFSLPYFHEQNGLAENFNRSVADIGRTILWSSQLPCTFWGFAFIWAAFTLNAIPNSLTDGRTPSEMLFGRSTSINCLKFFGETAFVHIPSEHRRKLDAHAIQAQVVAYLPDYKGWLFWIEATSTFVKSAWATFPRSNKVSISLSNMMKRSIKEHPPQRNRKLEVGFLLNKMELGYFTSKLTVLAQNKAAEALNANISLPKSFKQAMSSADRNKWSHAIRMELSNMKDMGVFEITPIPPGQHVLGGGWVFAVKTDPTRRRRFKARYVARGNLQRPTEDFANTFAPTASFTSLRLVLMLAAKNSWLVSTFDFVSAYLNAPIDETLWIRPPEGLHIPLGHGCLLKKALYGTRQAGRCWWTHLSSHLLQLGFVATPYYSSLYVNTSMDTFVWVHVDNGVVIAKDRRIMDDIKDALAALFHLKWKDGISSIAGIDVSLIPGGYFLSQNAASSDILNRHWTGQWSHKNPLPANITLPTLPDSHQPICQTKFLSIIGSLSYVVNATRPDMCFSVNILSRHQKNPGTEHWKALQHLLGYLKHTADYGVRLCPDPLMGMDVYSDASWGGEFSRSCHGFVALLHGCALLWCAKFLITIAAFSFHAEYMALSVATRHGLWIRELIFSLTGKWLAVDLCCDNASCVKISKDSISNKRTRHSNCDFFITNQALFQGKATLTWIPGVNMIADVMTKPLGPTLHRKFIDAVMASSKGYPAKPP
ncbi:hypothetical protein O181_057910 [Austropuccinia psidii MF-1]|uniref:Integrase catalytic domain-containing protein n=1 Tax=Austropuccinia psidii MF-1 TaxID=1389203 RepID=A0A9Q3EFI3_9BASI|nr:hypothetical protein [Austropuccinia psidii MF-1]